MGLKAEDIYIFTDNMRYLGKLSGIPSIELENGDGEELNTLVPNGGELSATFDAMADNCLAILSLFHGRKVTNNWLKMHGGVMRRKARHKHLL